jgi:acetate kinase
MTDAVLALNAGSSSTKFGLYEAGGAEPRLVLRGLLDLGDQPRLSAKAADGTALVDRTLAPAARDGSGFEELLGWIEERLGGERLRSVGHRIVHGGRKFVAPVALTDTVVEELDALTPLAPLHQPGSLRGVRAVARARPGLSQVGCFDTAFHQTIDATTARIALPRRYEAEGVRRYGFHGLSYEYIAARLAETSPALAAARTVVAHLGNGASLCAMRGGRSVDTTMGFSALDGLVMGTRPGSTDPGVLLYLIREKRLSLEALERLLYRESGLLGVSGISADMRTLLASREPAAREALDLFALRAARETAALAGTLQGLDCLVFTAGIGEHAAAIRAMICGRLAWLGVALDASANAAHADLISTPASRVEVRVIPTNEEIVIARHAVAVVSR